MPSKICESEDCHSTVYKNGLCLGCYEEDEEYKQSVANNHLS